MECRALPGGTRSTPSSSRHPSRRIRRWPEFVDTFPATLEDDVLYISIDFCTCAHLCACGCGEEVVTPLSPTQWSFTYNGKDVSLRPSVGNWTLETRWETKLAALAEAEQALQAARDTLPPSPGRSELEKLAADLPGLWQAPTTSNKDRKRLPRTLIADVTLLPEPDRGAARIGIRWRTGASDELRVPRSVHRGTAVRSPSPAVAMVTRLGQTTDTHELAGLLNAAGMITATDARSTPKPCSGSGTPTTSPPRTPTPTARSASPTPPAGSAPASASSTTGSRPANSPPAAAPATGSASPGPTASRPNAVAA